MIGATRFALGDIAADWRRSLGHIAAIAPIVAAYLLMIAVAGGLRNDAVVPEAQNIILVSPNAIDPASGRLSEDVLDLAAATSGDDAASISPLMFRAIRVNDRIVQFRAAPRATWEPVHGLTLLTGAWPAGEEEIIVTEGIAVATGWGVGTTAEIFGTEFTVTAVVRGPGTKFASLWMDFDRADRLFEQQAGFQMVTVQPASGADSIELRDRLAGVSGSDFAAYFEGDLVAAQTGRTAAADSLAVVATVVGVAALLFGGFNLAAVAVAERRRDIGIARAMGFTAGTIRLVTALRILILSIVGFLAGAVAATIAIVLTSAATIRGFVFDPSIPGVAWALGAALTVGAGIVGAGVAVETTNRQRVTGLLDRQ